MSSDDGEMTDIGVDHRVATDEVGEETFVFHAGLMSWKTFAADLASFADQYALRFEYSAKRGPLWGLLGVEVTCVVTGRFSGVTDFAEYARARIASWRDGNLAG